MVDQKWMPGSAYGPVLSSTDIYLLKAYNDFKSLEINPVLAGNFPKFKLVFNLSNGDIGGFDNEHPKDDLPLSESMREQPATCPRVQELHIITKASPWVCTVQARNPRRGVSIADVIAATLDMYTAHKIRPDEFSTLPHREQDRVRRVGAQYMQFDPQFGYGEALEKDLPRVAWLREKVFFDAIEYDEEYAVTRLGFKAPNVFIMTFVA